MKQNEPILAQNRRITARLRAENVQVPTGTLKNCTRDCSNTTLDTKTHQSPTQDTKLQVETPKGKGRVQSSVALDPAHHTTRGRETKSEGLLVVSLRCFKNSCKAVGSGRCEVYVSIFPRAMEKHKAHTTKRTSGPGGQLLSTLSNAKM